MNVCGNSDEVCKTLLDEGQRFDLVLTDPPYNVKKNFGNREDSKTPEEYFDLMQKRFALYHKLLKDNGSVVSFSGNPYFCYIQLAMYKAGFHYRHFSIWQYDNGTSRSIREPKQAFDPFLWCSKNDKEIVYNVDLIRVPYKSTERVKNPVYKKRADGTIYAWTPNPLGAMRNDVWAYPTLAGKLYEEERTDHPTQKPESLITELIKAHYPLVDGKLCGRILDPFHGSGTLGVCCEKLNKEGHKIDWVGIEMEEKWVEVANKRLENV